MSEQSWLPPFYGDGPPHQWDDPNVFIPGREGPPLPGYTNPAMYETVQEYDQAAQAEHAWQQIRQQQEAAYQTQLYAGPPPQVQRLPLQPAPHDDDRSAEPSAAPTASTTARPLTWASPPHQAKAGARGFGRLLRRLAVLVMVVVLAPSLVEEFNRRTATSGWAPLLAADGSDVPCPPAATRHLPPSDEGWSLLGLFETPQHAITVCGDGARRVFYDGQVKGAAPSAATHISLPADWDGDGYRAVNGEYVYRLTTARVVVSRLDVVLMDAPLSVLAAPQQRGAG